MSYRCQWHWRTAENPRGALQGDTAKARVGPPTLGLIWVNFVHLFMVSLLPFATAWIARTRLASSPVAFYAGLFVCIDIAYNVFEHEVLARADATWQRRVNS
jgi:uncharacterized membrane protein